MALVLYNTDISAGVIAGTELSSAGDISATGLGSFGSIEADMLSAGAGSITGELSVGDGLNLVGDLFVDNGRVGIEGLSSWGAATPAFQVHGHSLFGRSDLIGGLAANGYFDDTVWRTITNNPVAIMALGGSTGNFVFYRAPAAAIGTSVSPSVVMAINGVPSTTTGRLAVTTTAGHRAQTWTDGSNSTGFAGHPSSNVFAFGADTGYSLALYANNAEVARLTSTSLALTSNSTNSTFVSIANTAASGRSFSLFSSGGGPAAAGTFGVYDNTAGALRLLISTVKTSTLGGLSVYGSNDAIGNGLHLGFASNIASVYALEQGVAWRTLRLDGSAIELNSQSAANAVSIATAAQAWGIKALHLASTSLWDDTNGAGGFTNNGYYNGSAWIRTYAGGSAGFYGISGELIFRVSASGSAGAAITYSTVLQIGTYGEVHFSGQYERGVVSETLTFAQSAWPTPVNNPTGRHFRLSTLGAGGAGVYGVINIQGIAAAGDGRVITIYNIDPTSAGASQILLSRESGGASAANRIAHQNGGGTLTLNPGGSATLWYDNTSQRWRVVSIQ